MAAMYGDTMRNEQQAWNPFNASPFQAGQQQGGAFPQQGGDFGIIAQQIAGRVAQQLPALIMHLMASSPQLSQAIRQQLGSAWQGGQWQSPGQGGLGGLGGLAGGMGGGMGLGQPYSGQQYGQQFQPQHLGQFQSQQYGQNQQPQQFGQFQPQQYGQQFQPQQFGQQYGQQFQPLQFGQSHQQGVDIGVIHQLAGVVAQQLPTIITSLLASSPLLSQVIRQQGASHLSAYGGGAGLNPFGANQQQAGGLQQQGGDLAGVAQQIAGTVAQQLPATVMNAFASLPHLWGSGGMGSTAIH
jgi:hypothetical protein